ncbi:hypothetical protein JQ621_29920 [Bradyrhizobium manausense]|uniref:hypothetical protein n=1 Tax=Bradyrhizobium manausense TaxID=989370 RepID=UPI001BAC084A|nr:hypothetical protein [Bradyrhizobium manausense]MBR1091695.1 hypothetical protein [Bradyrhizobium manausense]
MSDFSFGWNRIKNIAGFSVDGLTPTQPMSAPLTLPTTGVSSHTDWSSLHYYVSFQLYNGTTLTVDGNTLFALDNFSFGDTQTLNIGSQSSGAGAGKVTFDPLHLSFSQLDLDPKLFQMLASGTPFKEVDVLGYKVDAHSSHLAVDYSFGLVAGKTLTIDNTGISQLDLEYGSEQLRDYVQNKNGSFPTTPTDLGGWDRLHNVSWLSSESSIPAAAATSSTTAPLTLPTTGVSNQTGPSSLHYYVSFQLYNGTTLTVDGNKLFALDNFSFSDTQTLNIGSQSSGAGAGKVAFNPLHLSFSQLDLDPKLFQMLASGTPFKEVDVLGYKTDAHSSHLAVDYSFGLVAGKTLTIDNTGISQLDLEYGSEQLRDYVQNKNGSFPTTPTDLGGWDRVHNVSWLSSESSIPAAAATSSTTAPLTLPTTGVSNQTGPSSLHYYVSFELQNGKMLTVDGDTLFALDSFSFSDTQTLNIGSQSSGAGAGKVTFDPLHLSFSQLDLDPKLFQMLASGTPFKEVDVLGYKTDAHSSHLAVDYSFGLVAGKTLTIDNTGISQLDLEYGREQLRDYVQNKNGSFPTTPTDLGGWDRVHNVSWLSGESSIPAAAATSSATAPLTLPTTGVSNQTGPSSLHYYVSFELQNGKMLTVNGDTLFAPDSFSFSDTQTLNIGSQSSGAGAGKVAFDPLQLNFSQLNLDPKLFQMLASGTPFKEVDVLGYKVDAHSSHLAVDYSFGLAAVKTLTVDPSGITRFSLEYGSEQIHVISAPVNDTVHLHTDLFLA